MLFDLAAWAVILVGALPVGNAVLVVLDANRLRLGDRFILASWIGIIAIALTLLGVSLFAALSPVTVGAVVIALAVPGLLVARPNVARPRVMRMLADAPIPRWALIVGIAAVALGAAMLASDPVTLYDSLVYHLGIIRWLHEYGTVPGLALIHNRLGHASAWFTLGAAFDTGAAANRAANVPLGLALALTGFQMAVSFGRIAAGRGTGSDGFLALTSAALIWAVVTYNNATPSPDVATSALIVVVAWSLLVVPRVAHDESALGWRGRLSPRLIPFVLAMGASAMKLFAIPAAVVTAMFYVFARVGDRGIREVVARTGVCVALGSVLLAPFIAANLVASGCPVFPAPIACLTTRWAVSPRMAADYTAYIRDVARWESRQSMAGAAVLPWAGVWIAKHPLLTTLAMTAPLLAPVLLRAPRRDGVRSALLLAVVGTAFAAWQAPAPRFLFAFVIVVPALALAFPLAASARDPFVPLSVQASRKRGAAGFVAAAIAVGLWYSVASQKVNIRSAIVRRGEMLRSVGSELLLPAAPEPPAKLYRWRVNDVLLLTPVPRPVADTLGYRSVVDGDAGFEKCSTAPLPCTPYLPGADIHLRRPSRGLSAGFVRVADSTELLTTRAQCLGELDGRASMSSTPNSDPPLDQNRLRCGEAASR